MHSVLIFGKIICWWIPPDIFDETEFYEDNIRILPEGDSMWKR